MAIVDDDASVRRSMGRLIGSLGYRAEAFASAEDFLSSGRVAEAACLILDVRMPGMDGLELQHRLAESDERVPILFVTARASEEEERRARAAGAVDLLRKPVARDVLVAALASVLGGADSGRGETDDD